MPLDRRHLLALGATAAVVAGAAALLPPGEEVAPPPSEAPLAFPNLPARLAAANRIEIRQGPQSLTLQRSGEAWTLPQKGNYPAQGPRVRELLTGLTELRLTERRTADPESLARLGLDEPGPTTQAALLRVLDAAGAPLAELVVGRRRMRTQPGSGGGGTPESAYIRRPGENQSYLAEGRLPLDADPQLWIDREIANLPEERVRRVIAVRDGRTIELLRDEGPDGRLRLVLPGDAPQADDVSLDEVGRALEALTLLDVRPEAQTPGDPAGEGRFILTDNLIVTARMRQAAGDVWMTLTAAGDDEAARLNARWRGWAYQVGAWKLPAFAPSLDTLRKREG